MKHVPGKSGDPDRSRTSPPLSVEHCEKAGFANQHFFQCPVCGSSHRIAIFPSCAPFVLTVFN